MNTTPPGTEAGGTFTAPPPPPPPGRPPWRFVRRERGKMIAGVTTGMADAFHIDVTVVRVIWVVVTVASAGLGLAAYAICWLAFPSELNPAPLAQIRHARYRGNGYIVGVVLLGIGALIVFGQLLATRPFRHFGALAWAIILIGGGLAVLFLRHPDDDDEPELTPPFISADAPEPTTTEFAESAGADDAGTDTGTADEATQPPPTTPGFPLPPVPPTSSAWTQTHPWPVGPPPRPRRPRRRPFLTPITISLLLIGAGAAALLDSTGAVHLTVAGVLASGLALVGVAMLVSAWFGRAHGLVPIGVILLLATIPAVSIDVPISGGVGARHYNPTTRSELQRNYELGMGQLVLNLQDAPLSGRVTSISASLGIGELDVDVPADVRVDVRAHVGAGATQLFGHDEGGWPQNTSVVAGAQQRGVLHLDLRVGAGSIQVRRWTPNGELITS